MKNTLLFSIAACALSFVCFAAEEPVNEQDPALMFEKRYSHGANAVMEKNWVDAQRHFEAALAALGQRDHIKKQTAMILVKKAQEESKKQRALYTANELLRLNQFKEAEEAFLSAKADLGDTEEIRQGLEAVRLRREQEPKLRAMQEREKEYMLALHEAQLLRDARKLEEARTFAQRAKALRPDDFRANELIRDIERRMKGGGKGLIGEGGFDDEPQRPQKPQAKPGDF